MSECHRRWTPISVFGELPTRNGSNRQALEFGYDSSTFQVFCSSQFGKNIWRPPRGRLKLCLPQAQESSHFVAIEHVRDVGSNAL